MKRLLATLALLLVLFPSVASAAVGFGGISSVSTASSYASIATGGTNPVGVVFVVGDDTTDNISATAWGAASMTKIAAVQVPGDRWISAWCVNSPASGGTITFTGGSFWRSFNAYYTGAQCPPVDSFSTATVSAGTEIAATTNIVAPGSWAIMFQKDNGGGKTYSAVNAVNTMRANADAGGIAIADSGTATSTGSNTGRMSASGAANHGAIIFSLAPAAENADASYFIIFE